MNTKLVANYINITHNAKGKDIFVFGLPDYKSGDVNLESHDPSSPIMNGALRISSNVIWEPICFGMRKPISNLELVTKDGKFFSCSDGKLTNFPVPPLEDHYVCFDGYYFDAEGQPELKKCFLDTKQMCIVLTNNTRLPLSLCSLARERSKIETFKYEIELVCLTTFEPFKFSDKPENYAKIHHIVVASNKPNIENTRKCFLDDTQNIYVIFPCHGGNVRVPQYLRSMFGFHTSVFGTNSGFGIRGEHTVDIKTFELIVRWLKQLIVTAEYLSCDELLEHEMNIDEWIAVCDYCDIHCLLQLFTGIKTELENN